MGIKQSNINNLLFFVYNILPIQEKIKFLSEIDDDDIDESISSKLFTKYINKTELVNLNTDEEINFIFYSNSDSTTVDICVNGDKMYLNSDFLFPLKSALLEFATSGLILFNNKIRKNRNIFKKRFYRSYDIINDSSDLFPLNNN